MKRIKKVCLSLTIFLLLASTASAEDAQSLLIPKIDVSVKAKNGIIELPAFCSDISKTWLDGALLGTILWGGAETVLHIISNGHNENRTLAFLVQHHYIKIVAGNVSVKIQSIKKFLKLISIESNGFLVGKNGSSSLITRPQYISGIGSFNDLRYNDDRWNYYVYQQSWWKVIHDVEKYNSEVLKNRLNEIAIKNFSKKGMEVILIGQNKIKLVDRGKNIKSVADFYDHQVFEIGQIRRLRLQPEDEIVDWEICLNVNPTDSAFMSLTLTGKYNNIVPLEIEYNSLNEIKLSTSVNKEIELTKGMTLEGSLAIEVEPKEKKTTFKSPFKDCEVKITGKLCYPGGVKIETEVCGIKLNMEVQNISFLNY